MSYESPQSWDDVDAGGIPLAWDTRLKKLLYPAYERMRLAVVERCPPVGVDIPEIMDLRVGHNEQVDLEWKNTFQSTLGSLINKYKNPNDTDLADASSPFRAFSEETILLAIGADSRLAPTYLFNSEWEIQQYKILNKLRYVEYRDRAVVNDGIYFRKSARATVIIFDPDAIAKSKAEADAAWAVAPWVQYSGDADLTLMHGWSGGGGWAQNYTYNQMKQNNILRVNPSRFAFDNASVLNVYYHTSPLSGTGSVFYKGFDPGGLALVENEWAMLQSQQIASSDDPITFNLEPTLPAQPPTPPYIDVYSANSCDVNGRIILSDNLFKFNDWL